MATSHDEGLKRLRTSSPPARIAIYPIDRFAYGLGGFSFVLAIVLSVMVYFGKLDCYVPDDFRHRARYIESWCANENISVIPLTNFLLLQSLLTLLPLVVFYGLVGQTIANVVASIKIHMHELSKSAMEEARKRLQDTEHDESEVGLAEDQAMRAELEENIPEIPESRSARPSMYRAHPSDYGRYGVAYEYRLGEEGSEEIPVADKDYQAKMASIEKKSVRLFKLARKQNPVGLFELAAPLARRNTTTINRYWWSIYFVVVVMIPLGFQTWFQLAWVSTYQVNGAFSTTLDTASHANVISCSNVPLLADHSSNPNVSSVLPYNVVCVFSVGQYLQAAWTYNYVIVTISSLLCIVRFFWSLASMNDDERMLEVACLQSMPAADLAFPSAAMAYIRKNQPKLAQWQEKQWEQNLKRSHQQQQQQEEMKYGNDRSIQHGGSMDPQLRSRLLPNEGASRL